VLPAAATVAGRVTERGRPVAGAHVVAGQAMADTDERGAFAIGGLAPGAVTVLVTHRAGVAQVEVGTVGEGERRTVAVALGAGGWIGGRVRREDGTPAVGAWVQATLQGRWLPPLPAAVVDAQGQYRLGPLLPGLVRVGVGDEPLFAPSDLAEVRMGVEERVVDLVVPAAGLAISGRVLDGAGRPVSSVALAAFAGAAELPAARTLSAADGTFIMPGLRRGQYLLTAGHPAFATTQQSVPAGRAIELRLAP
jgi:hypothetical protein